MQRNFSRRVPSNSSALLLLLFFPAWRFKRSSLSTCNNKTCAHKTKKKKPSHSFAFHENKCSANCIVYSRRISALICGPLQPRPFHLRQTVNKVGGLFRDDKRIGGGGCDPQPPKSSSKGLMRAADQVDGVKTFPGEGCWRGKLYPGPF